MFTTREKAWGLLEYKAMPSLRDIAHDGGCVHLLYKSIQNFLQVEAGHLLSGQLVRYGKGRRYTARPTSTRSHLSGSLSSSQHGGPPWWASPLAFGLIVYNPLAVCLIRQYSVMQSFMQPNHRLNMEVDLQSLFGLHITWCAQLYTRALLVSKERRHLFVTPWTEQKEEVEFTL